MLNQCEMDASVPEGGCETIKEVYRLQKETLKEIDSFKKAFVGTPRAGSTRAERTPDLCM